MGLIMDNILLCSSHIPLVTFIHNTFIEKYMLGANGSYVKVYLYLSKCIQSGQEDLSISSLADQMENTEKDILRALNYWEKQGLLAITRGQDKKTIQGIDVLDPDELSTTKPIPRKVSVKRTHCKTASSTASAGTSVSADAGPSRTMDSTLPGQPSSAAAHAGDAHPADSTPPGRSSSATAHAGNTHTADNTSHGRSSSAAHAGDTHSVDSTVHTDPARTIDSTAHSDPARSADSMLPRTDEVDAPPRSAVDDSTAQNRGNAAQPSSTNAPARQYSFHVTTEQAKRLAKNDEFCWTCNVIESYLGRPVKPSELQLVSYLYDSLHFSPELILHLYEYCISLGKTGVRYIQTVAISWDEQGVKTPEDAQNVSSTYNATYTAISRALALGRPLAAIEKKYIDHWQNDLQMDVSVILEACNRTVLKFQHADFKYTSGILDKWHNSGIQTLSDVERSDREYTRNRSFHRAASGSDSTRAKKRTPGMVQHALSRDDVDALEEKLLKL